MCALGERGTCVTVRIQRSTNSAGKLITTGGFRAAGIIGRGTTGMSLKTQNTRRLRSIESSGIPGKTARYLPYNRASLC